jgi:hypothetical protein
MLVEKYNPGLNEKIEGDCASTRYMLLTGQNHRSQKDPDKLIRILKAYGNADP